jgi:ribosomal protein S18 acetylase RimI-like enzyme
MRNSIRGVAADAVFLSEKDEQLAGFITCKLPTRELGTIELVAVDARFTGQRLGAALVDHAVRWMSAQGRRRAGVRTQLNNGPAVQLYRKMGFLEKNQTVTYRWTSR